VPQRTGSSATEPIDVLSQTCPTARISLELPLALLEEIDHAHDQVPRSTYLAQIIDAAMTRPAPHLPDHPPKEDLIDALADRRYRQHVRSIEIDRGH